MDRQQQILSSDSIAKLRSFMASSDRPAGTLSFNELEGFLFAIASSPNPMLPSDWLPLISNHEELCYADEAEANEILKLIFALYNDIQELITEHRVFLPLECEFQKDVLSNFDDESPISAWSRGFSFGYDWLDDGWQHYVPAEVEDEFVACLMTLVFFGSKDRALKLASSSQNRIMTSASNSFLRVADTIRDQFPAALVEFATYWQLAVENRPDGVSEQPQPIHVNKIGRNLPCPCGSGRKYKKCCGASAC